MRDLDVDPDSFGRWICAHELTHVFQFQGVPWLREHMSGLLRRYVATLEVRIQSGSAGGLPSLPDPVAWSRRSGRAGSLRWCNLLNSGH